ncbi:MAG TPA: acylphosphatase [Candidatus Paceibacterota bacterium]
MSEIKEIECLIYGRVTGVMFRDFIRRQARRLGLAGTVQNTADRAVRVIARGEASSLQRLIGYLKRGSLWSKVEKVEVVWHAPAAGECWAIGDFRIIY